jgi:hypothetical protein
VGPTERMDQFSGGFVCRRCRRGRPCLVAFS